MPVALVVGTRPESIKFAPLATLFGPDALSVHTGHHHAAGMTGRLTPNVIFDTVRNTTRGARLGAMTSALDQLVYERRPESVVVQGALAAFDKIWAHGHELNRKEAHEHA